MKTLEWVNNWKEILDENEVMPDNSPIPWVLVANKYDKLSEAFTMEQVDQEALDLACYNHR